MEVMGDNIHIQCYSICQFLIYSDLFVSLESASLLSCSGREVI